MATSAQRVRTVSMRKLSSAIDQAVSLAAKRYAIGSQKANLSHRGEILGRMVENVDIGQAFAFAEAVTAQINKVPGVDAAPAVTRLEHGVLMGFVDRGQTLRQLEGE